MKVAVLAPTGDTTAAALVARMARRPGDHTIAVADSSFPVGTRLVVDEHRVEVDGRDLAAFDTVFVRGFTYQDPVVPNPANDADWSLWQVEFVLDQQRFSAQYSVLAELDRRGVEIMNGPQAHLHAFARGQLANVLHACGVATPPTLCTNDDDVVERFRAEHGPLLWRPATGRAAWQRFERRQQDALVATDRPPIVLAPVVAGTLLRTWLCRGEPLLTLACAPASAEGLERTEVFWAVDDAASGASLLHATCAALTAPWLQVTYVFDGAMSTVYDVDVDPRLEWLPVVHHDYLLDTLTDRLLGDPATHPVPEGPHSRPQPFLRRMLSDLFAYEASKYPDDGGA